MCAEVQKTRAIFALMRLNFRNYYDPLFWGLDMTSTVCPHAARLCVVRFSIAASSICLAPAAAALDFYEAARNELRMGAVHVIGSGTVYSDVTLDMGSARVISTAPSGTVKTVGSYNPETNRLSVPSVAAGGVTFSNVLVQLGSDVRVVSVGGTTAVTQPLAVARSSYTQKSLAAAAVGPQVLPASAFFSSAVAYASWRRVIGPWSR